ncbi:hypothetical protein [Candidatus Hakubella thermalkaliphila]|uniref:hypothetical protein n=1 Tax=Candidatus Hakubella thermalkaliphila TaxID=2754717 RepID=UPI001594353B|nr:hypothetical protein [Candidatus Hakubella thermalkaliphila]
MRKLQIYKEEQEDFSYQLESFPSFCKSKNLSEKTTQWYHYILRSFEAFLSQENMESRPRHTTMDMIRNYVNLASSDLQSRHRKFSPLDRLL